MKAPPKLDSVSVMKNQNSTGPYPPLGFVPVLEGELGNGDYFGLYWPYGREDFDPIVCDMIHDERGLEPSFSSLPMFVEWLDLNGGSRGEVPVHDPLSPTKCFERAKTLIRVEELQEAINILQQLCDRIPEVADYWFSLATQLRRTGNREASVHAAVQAFSSNWVFGMPPLGTLRILQEAQKDSQFAGDPVVERIGSLSLNFGGTKDNPTYRFLKECVAAYLDAENAVLGVRLHQNYGFKMMMETTSFQERQSFDLNQWKIEHLHLCKKHLNDSRQTIG